MLERVLSALVGVPFLLGAAAAPAHSGEVLFRFQDPAIVEASALVVADGLVITSNDSGDIGRVFAVDPASGETVGVTHWSGPGSQSPTDVEALAPGPRVHGSATVWVGDIGDNTASRTSIQVAQVPVGRGDRTVQPTVYELSYPDGAHDAETLVRDPTTGRLYVASKGIFGGALYALPARLSTDHVNRLTKLGPVLPIATDGAFFPDGKHLIVRGYGSATIYDFPSLEKVRTLRLPAQQQGEGIGLTVRGRVLLDSEGLHSPVLQLPIPASVLAVVEPGSGPDLSYSDTPVTASPSARPAGTTSADHTASWLLGAGVLVLGVILAAAGRRRRRR